MANDDWESFKLWATETPRQGRLSWLYRGHEDARWQLQSTFFRMNPGSISLHDYRWFVISEIAYHYYALYGEVLDLMDGLQLAAFLSQLRHHGFPTPLLDWTMSPFVAAYFAFRDIQRRGARHSHARVFAFDYVAWQRNVPPPTNSVWDMFSSSGIHPFASILKPVPKNNPRIIPQQGRLMVSNAPDVSKLIEACERSSGTRYLHWQDIRTSEADRAMTELDLMGIREMTLFPDFEGLCRGVKMAAFSDASKTVPPSLAGIFERPFRN